MVNWSMINCFKLVKPNITTQIVTRHLWIYWKQDAFGKFYGFS